MVTRCLKSVIAQDTLVRTIAWEVQAQSETQHLYTCHHLLIRLHSVGHKIVAELMEFS